ncbi:MAG: FAD binding domain-containing protein, partial [Rhodobacteraceae bacterium]|nr:FAD binding domain-containing protein [Paracoccaceae bacterium]
PIGDTPPALISLGATVTLRRGIVQRSLPIEEFFIEYGKQDMQAGEFLESIHIPVPDPADIFAVYKISKRRDEDISSVCAAFRISFKDGVVANAVIAFGGMAATPKRAETTESALVGNLWNETTIAAAQLALKKDFKPISDMRASADYRELVAANLFRRLYLESSSQISRLMREQVA